MTEAENQKDHLMSSKQLWNYVFEQIQEIAHSKKGAPIFRDAQNWDESIQIDPGEAACIFTFNTTELNISKPSVNPDLPNLEKGGYRNEFVFYFDADSMKLTYTEAFPTRVQST